MKAFLYGLLCCLLLSAAVKAQEVQYTVLFDYDKYIIPDTSMVNVIKIIQNQRIDRVLLEGHCDSIGSRAYNYHLSDQRAGAVKKLLIANGISKENIKQCIGFGKDRPLKPNETPENRQLNRRVLMTFYLKDDGPVLVDQAIVAAPHGKPGKAMQEKKGKEQWDFLKVGATSLNQRADDTDYLKATQKNEPGMKAVVIKTEPEKKEFLKVDGTGTKGMLPNTEPVKEVPKVTETSAKKPVIVKAEPEKKDFLVVEDTKSRSWPLKNVEQKSEPQINETSADKPVVVKSEPEERDFLTVAANRSVPQATKSEAPKVTTTTAPPPVKPIVEKKQEEPQNFLQVYEPPPRTEMANIAEANIGDQIILDNILFEPGRHILKGESIDDLQKLLSALKDYPNLEIEIQGHVCCTTIEEDGFDWDLGTNNLSETRAQQIYLFLVNNGINGNRLTFKGYGGTRKINQDETKEELRRVNRRVEVKILKK